MSHWIKKHKKQIIALLCLSITILFLFYEALKPKEILPVYNPADFDKSLVDSSMWHIKKYHKVSDFRLQDQTGRFVSLSDFKEKIHIADFFFTTCPGICPVMTKNMKQVQDAFLDNPQIVLFSFSVTPETDTVEVLRAYGEKKGVIADKWHLLTGDKKEIYALARKSYMAVKTEGDGGADDMIHTQNFILVDKDLNIRGVYDGTEAQEIKKLIKDARALLAES